MDSTFWLRCVRRTTFCHFSQHAEQFDDDSVVVYQAYKPSIAAGIVAKQSFVDVAEFSQTRMTWVKTNFLWMMFRCGWAAKHNQERVLAIWIKRAAFERLLTLARTHGSVNGETVRLQWDPDHLPNGDSHPYRRAVQLGLKGIERFLNGQDLLRIEDVTPFVLEQGKIAEDSKRWGELLVARERVFVPRHVRAADLAQLELATPPKEKEALE